MKKPYDIFCSYAQHDNDDGWIERFIEALKKTYQKLTGQAPRVFLDKGSLLTADIWQKKILSALEAQYCIDSSHVTVLCLLCVVQTRMDNIFRTGE